tara:strand:- start:163 stop:486 length:324 start_codon:yes stop_codon:yes gene_type:complete
MTAAHEQAENYKTYKIQETYTVTRETYVEASSQKEAMAIVRRKVSKGVPLGHMNNADGGTRRIYGSFIAGRRDWFHHIHFAPAKKSRPQFSLIGKVTDPDFWREKRV